LTVSPFRPSFSSQPRVYPHPFDFAHPFFSSIYKLPLLTHRFARPLFSYNYELLFPQPLCFDKHLRCPMFFQSALCFSRHSSLATRHFSCLTLFLSHCYKVFVIAKKLNSFTIKQIHTLLQKHPGWGVLSASSFAVCLRSSPHKEEACRIHGQSAKT
jgi:hypothetical protein